MKATTSSRYALLCPRCRKLVNTDEFTCPYCGLARPGARWRHNALARLFTDSRRLIHAIILINVGMYLLSILIGGNRWHLAGNPMMFLRPESQGLLLLGATGAIPIDRLHHWWSLVSASYLHGGLLHILFNMLALRQIAPLVIREYGAHRMLAIYTLSGVCGFWLSYVAGVTFTIGASAAVCGLIGAMLYYGKSRGGIFGQAVYRQIGAWALAILVFGLVVPGINNWAHGGGMVAGMLLGLLMGYDERIKENGVHRWLGGLCLTGTALVLFWAVLNGLIEGYTLG